MRICPGCRAKLKEYALDCDACGRDLIEFVSKKVRLNSPAEVREAFSHAFTSRGFSLNEPKPLPVESSVKLTVALPAGLGEIDLVAHVSIVLDAPTGAQHPHNVILTLLDFDEIKQELVEQAQEGEEEEVGDALEGLEEEVDDALEGLDEEVDDALEGLELEEPPPTEEEPEIELSSDPEPEPEMELEVESDPEPEPDSEREPEIEIQMDPDPDPDPEPAPDPEPEIEVETPAQPEPDDEMDVEIEVEVDLDSEEDSSSSDEEEISFEIEVEPEKKPVRKRPIQDAMPTAAPDPEPTATPDELIDMEIKPGQRPRRSYKRIVKPKVPKDIDADKYRLDSNEVSNLMQQMLEPWDFPEDEEEEEEEILPPTVDTKRLQMLLSEQEAADLTDFTLKFSQAVTKTSYYTDEHQGADESKEGLFQSFEKVLGDHPEITYLSRITPEKKSILVYGLFDEPTDLSQVLLKGMSEIYIPKLSGYFDNKRLSSVSFKKGLDEEECLKFVRVLAAPISNEPGVADRFSAMLIEEGIRNISVVFVEDRLGNRKLSWRVEVALSRLRKDLSVLPLYDHLTEEELREVRIQVFRDVVRPIRQVNLIRELLENCDLVAKAVKEIGRKGLPQLEEEVLQAVPEGSLPALLEGMADDIAEARKNTDDVEAADRLIRLARRVAEMLTGAQAKKMEDVFYKMLDDEVLEFEDLPSYLQTKIVISDKADAFLGIWEDHLKLFDGVGSLEEYEKHLTFFGMILPELLTRHESICALRIFAYLTAHQHGKPPFPERPERAHAWLGAIGETNIGSAMRTQLVEADKVQREFLLDACKILEGAAVPLLLQAVYETSNRNARQEICNFLVEAKAYSLPLILEELEKEGLEWFHQRNLLWMLGEIADVSAIEAVKGFMAHEHPKVRLEAILAYCSLDLENIEKTLLSALRDPDPEIEEAAVERLVKMQCSAFLLADYFRKRLGDLDKTGDALARKLCGKLATYREGEGNTMAISILKGIFKEEKKKKGGFLAGLKSKMATEVEHEPVKIAACKALGYLKARSAKDVLKAQTDSHSELIRNAATHALRHIES